MYDKLERSNVEEIFELSMTQKGMLFHYLEDEDSSLFNVQIVLEIIGEFDIELIKQSLNHVQGRNEVLRSVFSWEKTNKPLQVILKETPIEFTVRNLAPNAETDLNSCRQYLEEERVRRFELSRVPIRFGTIQLSGDSHLLYITHHHILYDGWSTGILLKELFSTYNALLRKEETSIKDKTRYKVIQAATRSMEQQPESIEFWSKYLKDYEVTNLSLSDFNACGESGVEKIVLEDRTLNLDQFSAVHKVTKAAIFYTAYGIVLQKYLNKSDVAFGTTVSYRGGGVHNDESVMGNYINTVPIRFRTESNLTSLEAVSRMHRELIDKNSHNNTSYFEIKQLMGLSPGKNLFDSIVVIENYPLDKNLRNSSGSYQLKLHSVYEDTGLPLHITVFFDEGIRIEFAYNRNHFAGEAIKALSHHLLTVLKAILAKPSASITSINVLSDNERNMLLSDLNNTTVNYPVGKTVAELFEEQVYKTPDGRAVFGAFGLMNFQELNAHVNRLAWFLLDNGVNEGDIIGLLFERSIDFVINALAVIKAGGVYLPIDIAYQQERIDYIVQDSGMTCLLTNERILWAKNLNESCKFFCYDKLQNDIQKFASSNPPRVKSENIYVIYTSGSTGSPKGVIGTQEGLLNRLYWGWETYPVRADEVFCLKTNIGFVDHVAEMFSPLLSGVPVRVYSDDDILDARRMYSLLIRDRVTRITLVPTYLKALIDLKREKKLDEHSFKYVFCSGEQLSFALAKEFYREFSGALLINIYGSTEVSADATYYNVERYYVEDVLRYFKKYTQGQYNSSSKTDTKFNLDNNSITLPDVKIDEVAKSFRNTRVSAYPTSIEEYYSDFERNVLPYSVNTASTRFIGHMTSVLPDYVHDISKLISQLNQNLVKIETSKSLTFIEREAIAMLHRIFYSFPEEFYAEHIQKLKSNLGIIASGGSTANMSALLSARNKLLFGKNHNGFSKQSIYALLQQKGYRDFAILGSRLMHYSFHKAVSILGFGTDNIVYLNNDAEGAIDTANLQQQIDHCRSQNILIVAIIGIAGATETGAIDPLRKMAEVAQRNSIHFHVDAAWGGLLKFSDHYSKLLDGIELADSITFCGHKQLFLPQGISVCLFKDPDQLNYNSTEANYQAKADSYDFGRVMLEGSKSGLSLCLHASLKILGKKGYELLLDRGIKLANTFASMVRATTCLELVSLNINIVNYRYLPSKYRGKNISEISPQENLIINDINTRIQETQFLKGRAFVSKTKIRQKDELIVVFRAVLSNPLTTHQDLEYVLRDQFAIIEELYGETNSPDFGPYADKENSLDDNVDGLRENEVRTIPIGKPIANTKVFILDCNNELQPIGVPGEICVSGTGLAAGYLNNDVLTKERFIKNPFQENGRLYKTGDVGRRLHDGTVEFLGRVDDQVKIRGYRIELGEIENRLTMYPGIKNAIVAVKERKKERYLAAYYVSEENISEKDLRRYLLGRLPEYMLPVHYVRLKDIPLSSSGKVNRRALPEPTFSVVENHMAPSNEIETSLVQIWSKVLGTDTGSISINRSFFELGGNSMNLLTLQREMEKRLNIDLTVAELFRYTTIQSIVNHISGEDILNGDDLEMEVSGMNDILDEINNEQY